MGNHGGCQKIAREVKEGILTPEEINRPDH